MTGCSPPRLPEGEALRSLFFQVHDTSYGFHNPDDAVEVVNFRLTARGRLKKPPRTTVPAAEDEPIPIATRPVWFAAEAAVETPVYRRDDLAPGHRFVGPAIVEQLDTTTVVEPDNRVEMDDDGNLIISVPISAKGYA